MAASSSRVLLLWLALVVVLVNSIAAQQGGTTTYYVWDSDGNLVSEVTEPTPADDATPAAAAATTDTHSGSTASTSTDGGPMTVATQAPQPSNTQPRHPTQAPQPANPQSRQPTQAPQPSNTQPRQPTQAPQPPPPANTQPPQAPQQPPPPQQPTVTPALSATKKPSSAPSSTPSVAPASSLAPTPTTPATPATPATPGVPPSSPATTPSASPVVPAGTVGAATPPPSPPAVSTPTTPGSSGSSVEDRDETGMATASSSSSSSSPTSQDAANPLSEADGKLSDGTSRASSGGGALGTVVAIAGVVCILVGIAGFAVVNRKRQSLHDNKDSSVLDFESCSATPAMDGRQQQAAAALPVAAVPPAMAVTSPQRASYDFYRAPARKNSTAQLPRPAAATPVDPSVMQSTRARPQQPRPQQQQPVAAVQYGPAQGSILAASRDSTSSSFSRPSSDASFISSASVAPPLVRPVVPAPHPTSDSFAALTASFHPSSSTSSSSFHPTPSFVLAKGAVNPLTESIASSTNMEYEFSDDSATFQPVRNSRRMSAVVAIAVRNSGRVPATQQPQPQPIYDHDDDALSEDDCDAQEPEQEDEDGDFHGDWSDNAPSFMNGSMDATSSEESEGSFAASFYAPRDDSYSDDYAARGSAAGSAIRGSNDSLFSRSSSEFSNSHGSNALDDSFA